MFLVTRYWVDNFVIIHVTLGYVRNHLITGTVITVTTIAPRRTPRHDIYIAYTVCALAETQFRVEVRRLKRLKYEFD